jgi:hypothetical protein
MLRNISFVALILSLIISKQRVTSSVLPLLTEEAPLLVFYSSSYAQRLEQGLSAQARDTAQKEEKEEHADFNLRKVAVQRRKKGLRSSTKRIFIRLRNDSKLALN